MPMKLIRHPQSAKRKHPAIKAEVERTYHTLGKTIVTELMQEIADWGDKPTLTYKVVISNKRWSLTIKNDLRTSGGKKYQWADLGTGERSGLPGRTAYDIRPKKAKMLKFVVPYNAKTPPSGPTNQLPPGTYLAKKVTHPGIWPRKFMERKTNELKGRKSGSFHAITEAAIKRGIRRIIVRG